MSKNTIYLEACNKVAGFSAIGEEFIRKLVINGKSKSTHENYLRQISKLALYYDCPPLDLEIAELEEYLFYLVSEGTESRSSFKHLVYGLRKLYLLFGKEELHLSLPSIKQDLKLPVVLSQREMKHLLNAPANLRERVMFAFIYDTGVRINELANLLISDIDLDRRQIHIRRAKNRKDRYVPISSHTVRGLQKHFCLNAPSAYPFENPNRKGIPLSKTRIRGLLKEAVQKAGITKNVCVHTLRHTYATHQLEAGQNIMVVKESLGHADIRTTLIYLQVASINAVNKFGSLDALYPPKDE